tara:strand:- start:3920 stop:5227 length:1308 start_codon:yes stop_codon:yes gene_type:complete
MMKNNINIILVIIFLALSSCSDKSIDEDPQNTRFSVLKYDAEISETLTLDLSEIELGAPKEIFYWSKDFQNPQNNIAHIFTSANFSEKKKIISGKNKPLNLIQPVFFEDNLCHFINDGFIECINTETSETYFSIDIKRDEVKKYEFIRGGISYFDGTIIFVDGYGQIIALNSNSGDIIWQKSIPFPILSTPLIYRGIVYFISADNRLFAVDFDTGDTLWSFQTIVESKKSIYTASAVAFENIILAPFSNGELIAFKYDDGRPLWSDITSKVSLLSNFDIKDISANPVIASNNIYTLNTNGKFLSINLINGTRNWVADISGKNTPIISGNQIYLVSDDSKLICLNKMTGEIYWITQLEKHKKGENYKNLNLWLGPYALNNDLYLISYFGELLKVNPKDGKILDSKNLGITGIMVEPMILSDEIYIMDIDSNVYKFK